MTASNNGYGKGNPALPAVGALGTPGRGSASGRGRIEHAGGSDRPERGNVRHGCMEYRGVGNLNSKAVAIQATLFVANPGTGLDHVNRTDTQWLQLTGRLKMGRTSI